MEVDLPKDKKIFVEKNTVLLIPAISIHMDPEIYSNPKKFDPDRFSSENGGIKGFTDRGVFLTFGIGPRMCVGNRFANIQSKTAVASVVKNFEMTVNPKTPKEFVVHPQTVIVNVHDCFLNFKEI